jgi:branched-chain amino acid transport system ATP-binding protein
LARTFQNLALFKGMSVIDNIMTGRNLKIKSNLFLQALRIGPAEREEEPTASSSSTSSTSWKSRPYRKTPWASCPTACKSAWTWAAPGDGAAGAAARRTHGRHERGRKAGHVPLCPGRQRRVRHHGRADRARHGRGDGHLDRVVVLDYGKKIGDGTPKKCATTKK